MNSQSVQSLSTSTSTSILIADSTSSVPTSEDSALTETPKRRVKGSNWKRHEDVQLCKAWLNVSTDAITGTGQTMIKMWERILKEYESDPSFKDTRPRNSLMDRWDIIRIEVDKFCGYLAQIKARRQSGKLPEDELKDAKTMYMALETNNRPFVFEHCYEILSTNPRWQQVLDVSKEKTGASKRKISNEEEEASRPTGRKKEKLAAQRARRLDAYFEIMAANQEKRDATDVELMATINKQNALIQTAVDGDCMAVDASAISDPLRKAYFLKRQKEILERE
ncbi:hypothetical protein G6F56_007536 [Rhizopus delemar]|nr:hypothetical protein G6F56_007536 [Rhizopus delemar]